MEVEKSLGSCLAQPPGLEIDLGGGETSTQAPKLLSYSLTQTLLKQDLVSSSLAGEELYS